MMSGEMHPAGTVLSERLVSDIFRIEDGLIRRFDIGAALLPCRIRSRFAFGAGLAIRLGMSADASSRSSRRSHAWCGDTG